MHLIIYAVFLHGYLQSMFSGAIEITNGIKNISLLNFSDIRFKITSVAFILGFGGFSVFLQILSIISKHHLSIKPYFYGKILQALLASFYTFLFFKIF